MLSNVKIKVTTRTSLGVSTEHETAKEKWGSESEEVVEFAVQSQLSSVSVEVSAQVLLQNKKTAQLSCTRSMDIQLNSTTNFTDFYLQTKGDESYTLTLFGLNGEPIPNVHVALEYEFYPECFRASLEKVKKTKLVTDRKG